MSGFSARVCRVRGGGRVVGIGRRAAWWDELAAASLKNVLEALVLDGEASVRDVPRAQSISAGNERRRQDVIEDSSVVTQDLFFGFCMDFPIAVG